MASPPLCSNGEHSPSNGLRLPEALSPSTITQPSLLLHLPTELLVLIYAHIESDPFSQIMFAFTCKRALEISSLYGLFTCCIAPGTTLRTQLLYAIHPLSTFHTPSLHLNPTFSPAWHVCETCGKLKPTRAEYWSWKKEQAYAHIPDWAWNGAVRRFMCKQVRKCPPCELNMWTDFRNVVAGTWIGSLAAASS
ncbi:hypothetical protein BJY01DRAFT_256235 [Aspergillus pseudoustus]|uniref:F-box domain-containing protein n=1 Tax=Aspergillus pseudoustus TaxID=1810923 RepID=A0ABR4ICT5_9EURO